MFTYEVYNIKMKDRVVLSRRVEKAIRSMPRHIVVKLLAWVDEVETMGLEETRKIPGYHDEPLQGVRRGQRSIRLSRAYRAIYLLIEGQVRFVSVEEVSKHEY